MLVKFNLNPSQQARAAEVVTSVTQEVQTDEGQYWAGNLLARAGRSVVQIFLNHLFEL